MKIGTKIESNDIVQYKSKSKTIGHREPYATIYGGFENVNILKNNKSMATDTKYIGHGNIYSTYYLNKKKMLKPKNYVFDNFV